MSVNTVSSQTTSIPISQIQNIEEEITTSSIMSSSESEAITKQEIRLEERMQEIAKIISEEGETKSKNGATGAILGTTGTVIGTAVAIGACIFHAPIVAIVAGGIGLGSLIGGIFGAKNINKGGHRMVDGDTVCRAMLNLISYEKSLCKRNKTRRLVAIRFGVAKPRIDGLYRKSRISFQRNVLEGREISRGNASLGGV